LKVFNGERVCIFNRKGRKVFAKKRKAGGVVLGISIPTSDSGLPTFYSTAEGTEVFAKRAKLEE